METKFECYPLVTIVTPTYNQADYLAETIESVLNQSYPNIEYIVINDGSTDHTEQVLDRYRDKVVCIQQENIGQSATLNKGWSMAKGDFLTYLSSDDIIYPDAVASLVEGIVKYHHGDGVGLVYGDFDTINQNREKIKTLRSENYDEKRLIVDLVCQPGLLPLFVNSIFKSTGGWDINLKQVPDFDFWLRCSSLTIFKRLPIVVGGYRVHEGSASFSVMSHDRAFEIVSVVSRFYLTRNCEKLRRDAISNAYLIATKNSLQSKRFLLGVQYLLKAIKIRPVSLIKLTTYRLIISGVIRRSLY